MLHYSLILGSKFKWVMTRYTRAEESSDPQESDTGLYFGAAAQQWSFSRVYTIYTNKQKLDPRKRTHGIC
jgi:hypothetical protein